MRHLVLGLLLLLAAVLPAKADMYPDASNAKLPWTLTTTNDPQLNNGIHLITGYTGPLDNSVQTRWWGIQVQYGAGDCGDHMYYLFRYLRGFSYGIGSCATQASGGTVTQFIPGLFSVLSRSPNGGIPLIGQAMAGADGVGVWGINTVTTDTYIAAHGAAAGDSIAGTTMTIASPPLKGSFSVGDLINGTGVAPNSYIVSQLSGTPGGVGTYKLNYPSTVSNQRLSAKPYYFGGLVQDEFDRFCDLNDTRCRNIVDGSFPNGDQANVYGATLGGTVTPGDTLTITITDGMVAGSPRVVSYTTVPGDTLAAAAVGLAAAIHADTNLQAINYFARPVGNVLRIYYPTNNGPFVRPTTSFAQSVSGAATETISLGLLSSGNNQRFALGATTFSNSIGKWQNSFQSGDGAADFALMVGLWSPVTATGKRSQSIKWHYTDNTSSAATRLATMYVDPAGAGATGVDFVLDNNSGQTTNLRLANGGVTMAGNLVADMPVGNNHIMRTTVGNSNDTELWFQKARGGTSGPTVILANDNLGSIRFQGYDGTAYVNGASVIATSTSVAAGNVGGILAILTNGGERLRITDTMTVFGSPATAAAIKPSALGRLQTRTADDVGFAFHQAKLQTDTNYTAGVPVATGYLTLYDAAGTAYKVPACTAC